MLCFNISLFIVAAFLLLTLVVGIYFSRKKTTFREYAVGNKQFSTATLVATVLATAVGGGALIRNVECVHALGLWWIIVRIFDCFGLWVISKLALRMGPFMQHLSIAETIGSIYGKYPRVIAALVSICGSIIAITAQITVISQAINMCIGLDNHAGTTILATLLLIFYSTFGGIRAVTFTDVLQFVTFSVIIPLLTWFMFAKAGKPCAAIVPILQSQSKFQFSNLFHFNTELIALLFLVLSNLVSYINPQIIQRVYMSSGPTQAQKVFTYSTIFAIIIKILVILIGLFVFIEAPGLLKSEVWRYVMTHIPPLFKGFISISLIAMAMSTADSCLNACSIMVSHDIVTGLQSKQKMADTCQLKIARWTTLIVGLFAMVAAFYCKDLLKLMYWSLDCKIPILPAPLILAVFGFRGTSRTALMGMATGVLVILSWNKWVKPETGMDGSFIAMVANGLAMMVAHYLFKQPKEIGWVGPDPHFKQIQQAHARKQAERKEAIKNGWANRKITLTKLVPNHTIIVCAGIYVAITSLMAYFITPIGHHGCWLILQLFGAACCLGYPFLYDIFQKIRGIPSWFIGLCWLMGLAVYLPFNLFATWWNLTDPVFSASLSLAHCGVILWGLPLYLGIGVTATALLLSIYPIATGPYFPLLSSLLPLFIVSLLLLFTIIILFKVKQNYYIDQILYLKNQEKIARDRKLKASLYDSAMVPVTTTNTAKGYGAILTQVIGKIEESISFLDSNVPLYKQDFQSIINKLYDWVTYFNRRAKAKKARATTAYSNYFRSIDT
ncbi:MAG: sodium:solute symporter family protein [Candidatus Cardinium sp.]|nr:sodium:solute symporter family protein [Candidatus Cardinium sp.]